MRGYILGVCGAVIISALVMILLPEGKTGKFIKGIVRLFCLLVMLVPLLGFFQSIARGDYGQIVDPNGEMELDKTFIEFMYGRRADEDEEMLETALSEELAIVVSAEVLWNYAEYAYNVTEVKIKIENFGMCGEDEHIFIIEQVENFVADLVPDAEVTVYE